ncbi:MAG: molybdenum ABC transporter ATP-binding protein [Rhizobiaceae bacterium]
MIEIEVRKRLGEFSLDIGMRSAGRVTALFGPSGSGKTTAVNLLGGLLRPDAGRIAANGRVLADVSARIFVPKHRRRIGYVFQDARLFPHLSVRGNLDYARWFRRGSERSEFARVVDLLGIGHLLKRRPDGLSGGEKQRVAIGRALLCDPTLLLMDEPLASLDAQRKAEIMPYLERLRDETKIPIVLVSHSVAEVARLADTVAVLEDGRLKAIGETSDVLGRLDLLPAEERGEGGAVLDCEIAGHDTHYGMTLLATRAGPIRVPALKAATGARLRLRIRARDVIVATTQPHGLSALNVLAGSIADIRAEPGAPAVEVRLDCGGATIVASITRQSLEALGLKVGQPVYAIIKTVSFDALGA